MANTRVYRVDGQVVTQAAYLDHVARQAGFADRRAREAYRRSVQAAIAKGTRQPPPPPGAQTYRPGQRPTRAARARQPQDRWRDIAGGASRQLQSAKPDRIGSALEGARRRGERLVIVVAGAVSYKYPRPQRPGEATLVNVDPADIQAHIRAAGGDVMDGLRAALEASGTYGSTGAIDSVILRTYS